MKSYLWMGLSLVVLSVVALAESENEPYIEPILAKYVETIRDPELVKATKAAKEAFEKSDKALQKAKAELDDFEVDRLNELRKEVKELEKQAAEVEGSDSMKKFYQRKIDELKPRFEAAESSLSDTLKLLEKAEGEQQAASKAHQEALAKEKAGTDGKMAAMAQAIRDLNLNAKFDDKMLEGLKLDDKLQAIERKFDQLVVGAYVREKMSRSMAAVLCNASEVCNETNDKARKEKIDGMLDKAFYSPEGKWGRNREGGKTH